MSALEARGIGLSSLTEHIDRTTSGGRLVLHIFASLAGSSGPSFRSARGRGWQPHAAGPNDAKKVALARQLYGDKLTTVEKICRTLGVSRATFTDTSLSAPQDGGTPTRVSVVTGACYWLLGDAWCSGAQRV